MPDDSPASDAALVQRLARIIRSGDLAECVQALDALNAGVFTVEMWNRARALAEAQFEAETTEGGTS